MLLPLLAVLTTMHYEGDVDATGGDYVDVPFVVPAGTVEIEVSHTDGSDFTILDWGVWSPEGFRGWGGGNTENAIIGVQQSSRSYLPGPITPGTWTVAIGKAKLDPAGGHYSIDVICRDNATLAVKPKAAFAPTVLSPERRWYRGDFHVHSEESGDATASFQQITDLARSRHLDFLNLSDHNTDSQHALIAALQPMLPDLLLLRGAEITTYAGHGNSVGTSAYIDHRIGHAGRTVNDILDEVQAQGGVFIVNHPSLDLGDACIGCAWNHPDTDWGKVSGIEVLTGKWAFTERAFTPRAIAMWDEQEDAGHRIAAIGGSDDHRAGLDTSSTGTPLGSPTTLVLADNLSEQAIVDAVRHGRTVVQMRGPDDPVVDFTLDTGNGIAEVGDEDHAVSESAAKLLVHVTGGAGMFAQVFEDGAKVAQLDITSDDATVTYRPHGVGAHRYRIELVDDDNQRIVVTSHIYVDLVAGDGSCGCASGPGSGPLSGFALLYALKFVASRPWRWSRRRKFVRSSPDRRAPSDTDPLARSITATR